MNLNGSGDEGSHEQNDLDASNHADRQLNLLRVFPYLNGTLIPSTEDAQFGFASRDHDERIQTMQAFARVMRSWHGVESWPRATEDLVTKLMAGVELSDDQLDETESKLANHYILTFLNTFNRPPLLPHTL